MRVTTTLTTVMFAFLIGMLSPQPADAGKIKRGVVNKGEAVTLCANNISTNGGTKVMKDSDGKAFSVPENRQLVCQNVCTGVFENDVLINGCTQGRSGTQFGDTSCNRLTKPGQTYGPGSVVARNETSEILNVRLDCILTR